MEQVIKITPEPKRIYFRGRWFDFDGFQNFPEFLSKEFEVKKGSWKINWVQREGTGIEIKEKEINIWGDKNICFATILQLLIENKNKFPEVLIEEKLSFLFRGYHIDLARGGVLNLDAFKKLLRFLFLLKYNYLGIYFEDLFPWDKYPQIGKLRGRLQREELREIIDYGKNLGIEVFPSLELCGHMENILSLPDFGKFSEWHIPQEGCLDISNEDAKKFAYELLEEVIEFFPSRYIHIGGDETWALGRGKSLDKTGVFQGPELFEGYHRTLINMVKESGKIPIVWGDMLTGMYLREEEKERWNVVLESDIWDDTIIANWDYTHLPEEHFEKKIDMFGERVEKELACPGLSNWGRFYPNFGIAISNIKNFLLPAKRKKLPGFIITSWGDDGAECLHSYLYPLLLAAMEIAEGVGMWEEKWMALTGEREEILNVRKILGENDIVETIKHVFLGDLSYRYYTYVSHEDLKSTGDFWSDYYAQIASLLTDKNRLLAKYTETLEKIEETALPEDLALIRDMLRIGIKRVKNDLSYSDFVAFANKYAKLWISERKKENLDVVITKIFGAAGRADLKLF
ncbi:MAG TPA: beta-N-acetylhexosaminidase [Dictyoglomaceae bacterium]|nr:beta-N-acetylhexosaminidase [Dictyoglomaceae bacterium]